MFIILLFLALAVVVVVTVVAFSQPKPGPHRHSWNRTVSDMCNLSCNCGETSGPFHVFSGVDQRPTPVCLRCHAENPDCRYRRTFGVH